jgi:hypothetical protein
MKYMNLCICVIFLNWVVPIDVRQVMQDFDKPFDKTRFSKEVVLVKKNYQNNIFDSIVVSSDDKKKKAWLSIHSIMGVCDYIADKDSACKSCFIIWSDKAYLKF